MFTSWCPLLLLSAAPFFESLPKVNWYSNKIFTHYRGSVAVAPSFEFNWGEARYSKKEFTRRLFFAHFLCLAISEKDKFQYDWKQSVYCTIFNNFLPILFCPISPRHKAPPTPSCGSNSAALWSRSTACSGSAPTEINRMKMKISKPHLWKVVGANL